MDVSYKQNEMGVYRILIQMEQCLKKISSPFTEEWTSRLLMMEQQLQTRKFRLAVVGEFNRGKSSFINALLGKRILPEAVLATTATINRITYGDKPKAYLIMKDGDQKGKEIPVEELTSYVTKLTRESEKTASQIREAVVEYPTMLCFHDVDLIDTPGMNDMDDMNAVTVNQLEDIDLAVVAINAQAPYSETENHFVVKLLESQKICQIIFVITHIDMIRAKERQKMIDYLHSRIPEKVLEELNRHYQPEDRIFQKYQDIFGQLRLYGISSVEALDALEVNDMERYESSGFLRLSKELPQVILSSKSVNMIDNMVTRIELMIEEYKKKTGELETQGRLFRETEKELRALFSAGLQEMGKDANDEISPQELPATIESQKQSLAKELLDALGRVRGMEESHIHGVLFPVMQQGYKQINEYYLKRERRIINTVLGEKWPASLKRILSEKGAVMGRHPELESEFSAQLEKLNRLSDRAFLMNGLESLYAPGFRVSEEDIVFYWLESPVKAVLYTREGQSVLAEFRRIVNSCMDDCAGRVRGNLIKILNGRLEEIKRCMNECLSLFSQRADEWEKKAAMEAALLPELEALRGECQSLHEKIRPRKEVEI